MIFIMWGIVSSHRLDHKFLSLLQDHLFLGSGVHGWTFPGKAQEKLQAESFRSRRDLDAWQRSSLSTVMSTRSYFLVALLAFISLNAYTYATNVKNLETMDNLHSLFVSVSYRQSLWQSHLIAHFPFLQHIGRGFTWKVWADTKIEPVEADYRGKRVAYHETSLHLVIPLWPCLEFRAGNLLYQLVRCKYLSACWDALIKCSVPNFILAFIPERINGDTLNTMTAFAVGMRFT